MYRIFRKNKNISFPVSVLLLTVMIIGLFGSSGIEAASKKRVMATSVSADEEMRGVWFPYTAYKPSEYHNAKTFRAFVSKVYDNIAKRGMNAVFMHVRPVGDAMYPSQYYPWSKYISGTQGVDPGYDPLAIMIEEAHLRNLQFHAWINPYRVSFNTDPLTLSEDNSVRKYMTNQKTSDDRYVLVGNGSGGKWLFLNPSKPAMQTKIVNGVREIVENYDVDGIHFDDYFYPDLGSSSYKTAYDAPEYNSYAKKCKKRGEEPMDIVAWRKNNVNTLVKTVYATIKEIKPDCAFGISPGGYYRYYDNDPHRWYVDFRTWLSQPGYVDYICPQLYWSFNTLNPYPFRETLEAWASAVKDPSVKLYTGIAVYKMNAQAVVSTSNPIKDTEWYNQKILAAMVEEARANEKCSGFLFYDYDTLVATKNTSAVKYLQDKLEQ